MANKPVHIRYERDGRYPTGAEFIVTTLADAKRVHPEATVLSYADGTPVPAAPKPKPTRSKSKPKPKAPAGPDAAPAQETEPAKDGA